MATGQTSFTAMQLSMLMESSQRQLREQVDLDFNCEHCGAIFCHPRLLKCHKEKLHHDETTKTQQATPSCQINTATDNFHRSDTEEFQRKRDAFHCYWDSRKRKSEERIEAVFPGVVESARQWVANSLPLPLSASGLAGATTRTPVITQHEITETTPQPSPEVATEGSRVTIQTAEPAVPGAITVADELTGAPKTKLQQLQPPNPNANLEDNVFEANPPGVANSSAERFGSSVSVNETTEERVVVKIERDSCSTTTKDDNRKSTKATSTTSKRSETRKRRHPEDTKKRVYSHSDSSKRKETIPSTSSHAASTAKLSSGAYQNQRQRLNQKNSPSTFFVMRKKYGSAISCSKQLRVYLVRCDQSSDPLSAKWRMASMRHAVTRKMEYLREYRKKMDRVRERTKIVLEEGRKKIRERREKGKTGSPRRRKRVESVAAQIKRMNASARRLEHRLKMKFYHLRTLLRTKERCLRQSEPWCVVEGALGGMIATSCTNSPRRKRGKKRPHFQRPLSELEAIKDKNERLARKIRAWRKKIMVIKRQIKMTKLSKMSRQIHRPLIKLLVDCPLVRTTSKYSVELKFVEPDPKDYLVVGEEADERSEGLGSRRRRPRRRQVQRKVIRTERPIDLNSDLFSRDSGDSDEEEERNRRQIDQKASMPAADEIMKQKPAASTSKKRKIPTLSTGDEERVTKKRQESRFANDAEPRGPRNSGCDTTEAAKKSKRNTNEEGKEEKGGSKVKLKKTGKDSEKNEKTATNQPKETSGSRQAADPLSQASAHGEKDYSKEKSDHKRKRNHSTPKSEPESRGKKEHRRNMHTQVSATTTEGEEGGVNQKDVRALDNQSATTVLLPGNQPSVNDGPPTKETEHSAVRDNDTELPASPIYVPLTENEVSVEDNQPPGRSATKNSPASGGVEINIDENSDQVQTAARDGGRMETVTNDHKETAALTMAVGIEANPNTIHDSIQDQDIAFLSHVPSRDKAEVEEWRKREMECQMRQLEEMRNREREMEERERRLQRKKEQRSRKKKAKESTSVGSAPKSGELASKSGDGTKSAYESTENYDKKLDGEMMEDRTNEGDALRQANPPSCANNNPSQTVPLLSLLSPDASRTTQAVDANPQLPQCADLLNDMTIAMFAEQSAMTQNGTTSAPVTANRSSDGARTSYAPSVAASLSKFVFPTSGISNDTLFKTTQDNMPLNETVNAPPPPKLVINYVGHPSSSSSTLHKTATEELTSPSGSDETVEAVQHDETPTAKGKSGQTSTCPGPDSTRRPFLAPSSTDRTKMVRNCHLCEEGDDKGAPFPDNDLDQIRRHIFYHMEEEEECPNCDVDFSKMDGRLKTMHYLTRHQHAPTASCGECGDTFLYSWDINSHLCSEKVL